MTFTQWLFGNAPWVLLAAAIVIGLARAIFRRQP
jgi:hypothetical protein